MQADQEPSIEEILDSIRQIISDDEAPASAPAAAPPPPPEPKPAAPSPPPAPKPEPVQQEEEPLALTQRIDEPEPEPEPEPAPIEVEMQDIEPAPIPVPASFSEPEPEPQPESRPMPNDDVESMLTDRAQDAAYGAFSKLAQKARIQRGSDVTVEDVIRDEIRPMLRSWVDRHLPPLMERLLQQELDKIARRVQED